MLKLIGLMSLPLWECGLKYYNSDNSHNHFLSLPLWECGLKFRSTGLRHVNGCHSPCGSVDWNYDYLKTGTLTSVTPLVGVWIEIADRKSLEQIQMSLPLWECGLKSWSRNNPAVRKSVTPLVGVWIEITSDRYFTRSLASLPLWECGLKCLYKNLNLHHEPSLPLWEWGLKYVHIAIW